MNLCSLCAISLQKWEETLYVAWEENMGGTFSLLFGALLYRWKQGDHKTNWFHTDHQQGLHELLTSCMSLGIYVVRYKKGPHARGYLSLLQYIKLLDF